MAKSNKAMVPVLIGVGALALLMMGGKKASAKGAGTVPSGTGELPGGGGIDVPTTPPNSNIPTEKPSAKPVNPGPVTTAEELNAAIAVNEASTVSNIFPNGYGDKKPGQSNLDWATNMAFWLSYSFPGTYKVKNNYEELIGLPAATSAFYGGDPVPYKLTKGMAKVDGKGYEYWSQVWLRIRKYLKSQYPDVFK